MLAAAVKAYSAHAGHLPSSLTDLAVTMSNDKGAPAGSFIATVPTPPYGWTAYNYATAANSTFTISSTDGNTAVRSMGDETVVGQP